MIRVMLNGEVFEDVIPERVRPCLFCYGETLCGRKFKIDSMGNISILDQISYFENKED